LDKFLVSILQGAELCGKIKPKTKCFQAKLCGKQSINDNLTLKTEKAMQKN